MTDEVVEAAAMCMIAQADECVRFAKTFKRVNNILNFDKLL